MKRMLTGVLMAGLLTTLVSLVTAQTPPPVATPPTKPVDSPATPVTAEGSEEKVRVTPFTFPDEKYGMSVSVFEAIPAANDPTQKRLYISPLCRVIPFDDKGKPYEIVDLSEARTRVQLRVLYYYPDLLSQAAERINTQNKTTFRKEQISLLAVSMLKHEIVGFPGIRPETVGDLGARVQLPESKVIQFDVPSADIEMVKKLAMSRGGLQIQTTLFYNALNLKKKVITWTVEDIRNTRAFRELSSGGSNFVSARQFQDILQEVGRNQNITQYEDPGADGEIDKAATTAFNKLLDNSAELVINSAAKSAEVDEQIRTATKITAKEFMPVQLSYKYTQDVLNESDYNKANSKAEEFYRNEKTQLSISAKARYGPVSGSASYGRTTDQTEHKAFKDQMEFNEFKRTHRNENGNGVRFQPRQIELTEKGEFVSKLNFAASQVLIKPVNEVNRLVIPSSTTDGSVTFSTYLSQVDDSQKALAEIKKQLSEIRGKTINLKSVYVAFAPSERINDAKSAWDNQNGQGWSDKNVWFCAPKEAKEGVFSFSLKDRDIECARVLGAWYIPERGTIDDTWVYARAVALDDNKTLRLQGHPSRKDASVSIGRVYLLFEELKK
jgi:hypothetical protein